MTGTIARLVPDKGFGFLRGDDNVDRFFHRSSVRDNRFDDLSERQRVAFADVASDRGPRANDVRPDDQ